MKPLLILAPAPNRWRALEGLLDGLAPELMEDVEFRLSRGVPNAQDAFAVIPDGGHMLACASINRRDHVGVLGYVFTRPDQRGKGFARQCIQTALSWFDMSGGRRLYSRSTADAAESLYVKFGFEVIHRVDVAGRAEVMLRRGNEVKLDLGVGAANSTRELTRADWPLIVALLAVRHGPDPRVSLAESAIAAEAGALELVRQQDRGTCRLIGTLGDGELLSFASLATDTLGERTYAMIVPYSDPQTGLREAVIALAASKGYSQVDFPMEALHA